MEVFLVPELTESEKLEALNALRTPALQKYLRLLATAAATQTMDFDVASVFIGQDNRALEKSMLQANGCIALIRELVNEAEIPSSLAPAPRT